MKGDFEPKITAFCCEHSGLLSANMAVESRFVFSNDVQMIRVPCSGKIEAIHIMKALEEGDGVAVFACHKEACQFLRGNLRAEARVSSIKEILKEIGVEEERVQMYYLAPSNGIKFAQLLRVFYENLKKLGPNVGRKVG
ncbi:MAG TPA: hydrogenase iron-sulfur subunit [Actinobacteria bacterium]|nr:hydrogenase iron-sulfur subunit [Actinomycetota bacterium]